MSDLRLKLDTTNFQELVELGRSLIPTVAPGWTDHNVHDPGITLMELVAWIADAQIYALGRSSRREREAYGRLLGLVLTGPQPSRGLLWPHAADAAPGTPPPWPSNTVVDAGQRSSIDRAKAPAFVTMRRLELTTAELTQVLTHFADGTARDWTRVNSQQGATFKPFGHRPAPGDRLELTLTGTLIGRPADGKPPSGAPISLGFELVSTPAVAAGGVDAADRDGADRAGCTTASLQAVLSDGTTTWPLPIVEDTTQALHRTGVVLLQPPSELAGRQGRFTVSIGTTAGFLLPPRVQRIALNVLPVEQVETITDDSPPFGTGLPDQTYQLRTAGLMHPLDDRFEVSVADGASLVPWTRVADLAAADPGEAVYAVEPATGRVRFGNGLNGRVPEAGAALRVVYRVTAGSRGNLPRGNVWTVLGLPGPFGVNSEATSGGRDARDLAALRAVARSRVRNVRPIVTSRDLEDAARALADLQVRRARELPVTVGSRRSSGTRVLVAVGPHEPAGAVDTFDESPLWLGEIHRRLAPRLPLGQRLDVIGPRLVDVRVIARLIASAQSDPEAVRMAVEQTLRARLAISSGGDVWPFGRDVTALTVKGWLRKVEGVARVDDVRLRTADGERDHAALGPTALPRLRLEPGDILVTRPSLGGPA
jgi:predicted phage baseplate assembly protein